MPKLIHKTKVPGTKLHRLTFIEETENRNRDGKRLSTFRCDCGNVLHRTFSYIASGKAKSCGCLNDETRKANAKKANAAVAMVGRRFGNLTVIELHGVDKRNKSPIWLCQCDCGREHLSTGKNLRSSITTRCTVCSLKARPDEISMGIERKVELQHADPMKSRFYQSLPAFLR